MSLTSVRRVGNVEVVALTDGIEVLDMTMAEAFPDLPADAHETVMAAYPSLYGPGGGWRLHVRAWLVRHADGALLLDTGVGPATSASMAWYPTPGRLHEALAEAGSSADQIDTVVVSHVHDDHVGGTVDEQGALAFPRARYLVQRADLEALAAWANESDEDRIIEATMIEPIRDLGQLDAIDGEVALSHELTLRPAPGHTPGHQVLIVLSEGERLVLSADTWNHPAQFSHPEWASGTDVDPERATATRREVLADLLAHPSSVLGPTHLDAPFGRIVMDADGRARFEAVAT